MNGKRILSGVVLVMSMLAGFTVWSQANFLAGAITFVVGAVIAGSLHNSGERDER